MRWISLRGWRGKTCLAKQLAERTGAVYVSVADAVAMLLDAVPCQLSKDIRQTLQEGQRLSDAMAPRAQVDASS